MTNTAELIGEFRSTLLPAVQASQENLARVADQQFVLQLSSAETQLDDLTLDWGDLQILRAGLSAIEYLGHTMSTWNLSLRWEAIEALTEEGSPAFGRILLRYPELLEFRDASELTPARIAFTRAIETYLAGSLFIRQRPLSVVRLFNMDDDMSEKERGFRRTLEDLRSSLNGRLALRENPNLLLDGARHFDTHRSLRELLPRFGARGILANSMPDLTFNGLIEGLTSTEVDQALSGTWEIEPHLSLSIGGSPRLVQLSLASLTGLNYDILRSEDLVHWEPISATMVYDSPLALTLPATAALANGVTSFYQATERSHVVNDDFRNRIPLPSSGGEFYASYAFATRELGEPIHRNMEFMSGTVWWTWTAPANGLLEIQAIDTFAPVEVYTGSALSQLIPADRLSPFDPIFHVSAGTTYQIVMAADFDFDGQSRFSLRMVSEASNDKFANRTPIEAGDQLITSSNLGATGEEQEPLHISFGDPASRRSIWYTWKAPKTGRFTLEIPPNQDQPFFAIYTGNTLSTLTLVQDTMDPSMSTVFDVTSGTQYQIALDHFYSTTFRFRLVETPPPANDNFANPAVLSGSEIGVAVSNRGATAELGEFGHGSFAPASHSLWFQWVAPQNGRLRLSGSGGDFDALVGVYTGSSLDNLEFVQPADGGIADYRPVQKGVSYRIAVDSPNGQTGTIILRLWLEPVPF